MKTVALKAAGGGFFGDLFDYLYNVYFNSDGQYYENIDFGKSPLFSLRLTVLFLFIGTVAAAVYMAYNKQTVGGIIRRLIKNGCNSPENAKTLTELGCGKDPFARLAVMGNINLFRFVRCVGAEKYEALIAEDGDGEAAVDNNDPQNGEAVTECPGDCNSENNENTDGSKRHGKASPRSKSKKHQKYLIDPATDSFYIPEELRIRAEVRYERKGSGWLATILGISLLAVAFFLILLFLPKLLEIINGIIATKK